MTPLRIVVSAILLLIAHSAYSQDCSALEENAAKFCSSDALGSAASFRACAHQSMLVDDCRMNVEYKKLIALLKKKPLHSRTLSEVISTQRTWINYRDKHCHAFDLIYRDVTWDCPACISRTCLADMTKTRTGEIVELITCLEEENCPVAL
jgi:uncharacterized protein YecT (DUF1311 family)